MAKVKFYFKDSSTEVYDMNTNIKRIRSSDDSRPVMAVVYGRVEDKVNEYGSFWIRVVPSICVGGVTKVVSKGLVDESLYT